MIFIFTLIPGIQHLENMNFTINLVTLKVALSPNMQLYEIQSQFARSVMYFISDVMHCR